MKYEKAIAVVSHVNMDAATINNKLLEKGRKL